MRCVRNMEAHCEDKCMAEPSRRHPQQVPQLAAVGFKSLIVSPLWTGREQRTSLERDSGRRAGGGRDEASLALQQVEGAQVLVQGLDAKAVAALAVEGAALLDGRGRVGPLLPGLRGDQAAPLRLVLRIMRCGTTVK